MRASVEKPLSGKRVYCKLYQFEEGKHVASDAITVYGATAKQVRRLIADAVKRYGTNRRRK